MSDLREAFEAFEALENLRQWADDHPAGIEDEVETWYSTVTEALSANGGEAGWRSGYPIYDTEGGICHIPLKGYPDHMVVAFNSNGELVDGCGDTIGCELADVERWKPISFEPAASSGNQAVMGARDALREAAKQFRCTDDAGHSSVCDRHADELDAILAHPAPPSVAVPEFLLEMSKQMREQPNRMTAHPFWQVRCNRYLPTLEGYSEHHIEICGDDGVVYRSDRPVSDLHDYLVENHEEWCQQWAEENHDDDDWKEAVKCYFDLDCDDLPEELRKVPVQEVEEVVSTHLTQAGAEQFIKRKQHDYPKLFTYVESAYWSPQLRELQDWIISLTAAPSPDHSGDDEYETRGDGKRVRKDRWEIGFRNIVTHTVGPRTEFEIEDIVELVREKFAAPDHIADAGKVSGWPEITKMIQDFVAEYEYTDGEGGYYTPTDWQRHMIEDAIHGVLSEIPLRPVIPSVPENEVKARAVEQAFAQLASEYAPHGLRKNYTAFDVSQHIEAQGKAFAARLRTAGDKGEESQ